MLYLVSEGDVYTRETAPDHLRSYNFGDWAIFEADSEERALEMSRAFDASANERRNNAIARKTAEIMDRRLQEEYAELTAYEWLDVMPHLRFTRHGFGQEGGAS